MRTSNQKTVSALALAVALGLGSGVAAAKDLGYTYVEGGYQNIDIDDLDEDGDGYVIGGSVALTDMFHAFGGYGHAEIDVGGFGDVDYDTWEIGGGLNYRIGGNTDFVGRVSYVSAELDAGFDDVDDDGYRLYAGLRAAFDAPVEIEGGVAYTDLNDYGDETAFFAAGRYYFTEQWAVGGSVSAGEDQTTWALTVRWEMH